MCYGHDDGWSAGAGRLGGFREARIKAFDDGEAKRFGRRAEVPFPQLAKHVLFVQEDDGKSSVNQAAVLLLVC